MPKPLVFRQKYSATRRILNSHLGVWKCDETLSLVFDILYYLKYMKIFQKSGRASAQPKEDVWNSVKLDSPYFVNGHSSENRLYSSVHLHIYGNLALEFPLKN